MNIKMDSKNKNINNNLKKNDNKNNMSMKLNSDIKEFEKFLNEHKKTETDEICTHTSFGHPWGSFYINDDDLDKFYELYIKILGKTNLHIVERPKTVGPLLIDIDLKFNDEFKERQYTIDDIKYVIKNTIVLLGKYYKLTKRMARSFVFEKNKPTYIEKNKTYKDGFHIVFPFMPISKSMRYLIITELTDLVENKNGFEHLSYCNDIKDVFDISIISRNGWFLYGSKKPENQMYVLTNVFAYNLEKEKNEYNKADLVTILSNRKYKEDDEIKIKDDVNIINLNKNISKILEKYEGVNNNKKKTKNKIVQNDSEENENNNNDNNNNNKKNKFVKNKKRGTNDINLAKKLVNVLSIKRAESYQDWIRVCWVLHNISDNLLETFIEFSKKSPTNFDKKACEKVWDAAKDGGLTISSLHMWAKQDNLDEYSKTMRESINELFEEAETGTEYDIAKVVFELYKHIYKCSSIKQNIWYEFQKHRWRSIESGHTLHTKISEELTTEFAHLGSSLYAKGAAAEGQERDGLLKRAEKVNKIILSLKKSGFKRSVLEESARLFFDQNFEELLDSNPNLIGFDNGIYDLKIGAFREGTPDDYVTYTVGYDYVEYSFEHPYVKALEEYFAKVMLERDMREYILTLLASYLDGNTEEQKLIIWTGGGCHAKGTKILMHNGSIKNVEDIKIGDKLMGDDSKQKLVKTLYRGKDAMYKVIPIKGDPYIVNKDHVLSLKATGIRNISWSGKKQRYKLIWHEKDKKNLPKACHKNFPIKYYNSKKEAYNEASKHKNILDMNPSVINKGDVIDIKIKDYLTIRNKLGKRNYFGFKIGIKFDEKKLPLDPYILGYWLGDGQLDNTGIGYAKSDINHFRNILKKYNLLKKNKYIPEDFKCNSRENRLKLLAGILDSDGYYQKYRNQYEIYQKSEKLINDIIYLARSLGFAAYKYETIKTCANTKKGSKKSIYFRTQIYGSGLEQIPTILNIKNKNIKRKKDPLLNGLNFEFVGIDNYYGFELDGNGRYLMEDMTVTHNSNGKSKTVEFYQQAFGNYCDVLPITVLTKKRGSSGAATPELANLKGKRFVVFQEPEGDDQIYVGFMKELTGSDYIYARPLFRDPIKFKPQFKLLLTCNKLPHISSTDGGTWRRLRVAPWESEFVDLDENGLKDGEKLKSNQFPKDFTLTEKMKLWKAAFMWYLVKKYYKIYKTLKLKEPEKVLSHTKKYKKQKDIYCEFLDENLEHTNNKKDFELFDTVYSYFRTWYRESYSNNCPIKKEFEEYLLTHDYQKKGRFIFGVKCVDDQKEENLLDEKEPN
ncbi:D5 DNA Primase [uncultured virus]|nr:D5 DNA Primase [uncultured virus]